MMRIIPEIGTRAMNGIKNMKGKIMSVDDINFWGNFVFIASLVLGVLSSMRWRSSFFPRSKGKRQDFKADHARANP